MAEESKKTESVAAATRARSDQSVGVRLMPNGKSDVPLLANFARVQVSAPAVMVDFGFHEPAALGALAQRARNGGKMPEAINGHLAARLALSPEALVALHQQLGQAIDGLRAPRKPRETTQPG